MKQYKSRIEIEYEVNDYEQGLEYDYDLESEWYGDHRPQKAEWLMTEMQFARDEAEYQEAFSDLKELLTYLAKECAKERENDNV